MNRRAVVVVSIVAVVIIGAGWVAKHWFAPPPYHGVPFDRLSESGKENYRHLTASRWERWRWAHAKISARGIVVDETGEPVPGASVSYSIQNLDDWNPPPRTYLRSDEAGRFTISEGTGYRASISADHAAYHMLRESTAHVYPRGSLYEEVDRYRFDPGEEVRLVLRKKLPLEPLVNHLQERYPIPANGKLTLAVDKVGDKLLLLEFRATPPAPGTLPFDWELRIVPKDGKIQVKAKSLQMLAPTDGYLPEITLTRRVADTTWFAADQTSFFLRFEDGTYASGEIFCHARDRRVVFNCYYNPAKSRNLEPGLKVE